MKPTHTLRDSFGVPDTVPVTIVVAELSRIDTRDGRIAPQVVVDEAQPASAPLHEAFEWRNGKAANLYRLIQARNLIRAVHVVGEDGEDRGCAFVHVTIEKEGCYQSVARVVSNAELFEIAMAELRLKLEMAAKAVADLEAAATENKPRAMLAKARRHSERAAKALRA